MEKRIHKNFMMIPNKLWEALYNKPLPEQERQVWDYIYRFTTGWGCEMAELSTYIIAKDLKISDVNIRRDIRALKRKKRIIVKGKSKGIQKDFTLWTVERICSSKGKEQICSSTRANKLVLLEPKCSLIKETPKDKKKERVFSKPKDEEQMRKNRESVAGFIRGIGDLPDKKK